MRLLFIDSQEILFKEFLRNFGITELFSTSRRTFFAGIWRITFELMLHKIRDYELK